MCGRFVSSSSPDELAAYFGTEALEGSEAPVADSDPERPTPGSNFNVAPTNDVFVVLEDGSTDTRHLDQFHWGLIPHWAKEPKIGSRMINARAETLAEKNAFKSSFAKRRCIIPADGFYEWKKIPGQKNKQPMYMSRPDGEPLAFAGLWSVWRDKRDGADPAPLRSTTIITTSANEVIEEVHDRMPVILPQSRWDEWLDPSNDDLGSLGQLLVPADPALLELRPVSTDVNYVRNKGAHLIERVDPEPTLL